MASPPRSSSAPTPETRIITHMNADHHDSLVRYLEHHHSVPSHLARHATLTSIKPTHLQISTSPSIASFKNNQNYIVPIEPPLADLSAARERLVAMDQAAITALGRSEVTVKVYAPPRTPFQIAAVCTTLSVIFFFSSRRNLDPANSGGLFYPLASRFPDAFAWFARVQGRVWWSLVGIHVLECLQLDRSRLRKHSVPRGGGVWWAWMASNFVEGFTAPLRFDAIVKREKERKARAKH
ncbi:MAG: hypothetical protein M1828_003956 [Chrysothrix sp. TS-e1954]|nr:MAG: hypothetical protein M1828_003956 [Chrysothrix sp. TS-e1954]